MFTFYFSSWFNHILPVDLFLVQISFLVENASLLLPVWRANQTTHKNHSTQFGAIIHHTQLGAINDNFIDANNGISAIITKDKTVVVVVVVVVVAAATTTINIIIILSYHLHGYPWPSLATPPYCSSFLAGPQGYIPYSHRAAVCRFELVTLLLLGHVKGSIGEHHLWARPCFSSSVLHVWFV